MSGLTRVARWRLGAACVLVLGLVAACGRSAKPPNVIVILIDTLRADRVGFLGNTRGLTPTLDALAERGVVFHRAMAASSWTSPSVASLFTSRFPSQHGVVSISSVLPASEQTVVEELAARGYAAAGFSANVLIGPGTGFGQGFDVLRAFPAEKVPDLPKHQWLPQRAAMLNERALAWLDTQKPDRPVFLYLQYMEPHAPYAPSPAAAKHVFGDAPVPNLVEVNDLFFLGLGIPIEPPMLKNITDCYDAMVRTVDAEIGQMLAELERRGILDDAILVVTADHGEEFKDHGLMSHGHTLYDEVVHVPLLIVPPGGTSRRDVHEVVSLLDVAPTLLDLVGGKTASTFVGASLRGFIDDHLLSRLRWWWHRWRTGAPASGQAFSELVRTMMTGSTAKRYTPHERTIVREDTKLIDGVDDSQQFYDLAKDPGEHDPNALSPPVRQDLSTALEEMVTRSRKAMTTAERRNLDDETREKLKALGYVE